ncbi:hypothetical protein JCM8097_003620 [Rhodosporidiobolus ruineniae]
MAEGDEQEPSASVSSLRARFEQLGTKSTAAPALSPKPSSLGYGAGTPRTATPAASVEIEDGKARAAGVLSDDKGKSATDDVEAVATKEETAAPAEAPKRAAPPPRPPKPIAMPRPPSIVVAEPSPSLSSPPQPPSIPSPLPSPRLSELPRPVSPFDSPPAEPEPAAAQPPPPPLATRPDLTSKPSLRRPAPPPPASRIKAPAPEVVEVTSTAPGVAAPLNAQPSFPSPPPVQPAPSPSLSVKNLASRFSSSEPSLLSRTPSAASVVRSPSPLGEEDKPDPFSEEEKEDERDEDSDEEEEREGDEGYSSPGSIYSSSPEVAMRPKPRPVIPPRPVLSQSSAPQPSTAPPLPSRSSTVSSSASLDVPIPFTRSPSNSLSNGSPAPPVLPPRREDTLSPAPPLPARKNSGPPAVLPPRPSATAPPATNLPYIPPPPPTRTAPSSGSITPVRPPVARGGGDDESEEEDEDDAAAKGQEFPDATFANRRPPVLRNRRTIQVSNQFSAFAVRGLRVVTGHHRIHVWYPSMSSTAENLVISNDQQKFLSLEFRAADDDRPEDDGRFVWAGTKDGGVYEIDTEHLVVTQSRQMHATAVHWIFRVGKAMVSIDEGGKVVFWGSSLHNDGRAPDLQGGPYKQQRVPEKQTWAAMVGDELWTSSGPTTKPGSSAVSMRSPQIRVFDPSGARGGAFALLPRPLVTPEAAGNVGAVTCHAIVPHQDHLVYLGHDNGFVSVWDRSSYECVLVQRISPYAVSALCGVRRYLWAGFRTGELYVYDVESEPWVVKKAWKAHKDPVIRLVVDPASLWKDETLQVASASNDTVCLWDGFLRDDWLDSELHLRQPDFCTFRSIRTLSCTWNVDSRRPNDLHGTQENLEFLHDLLTSVESPDIISFGFQEMIDLGDKKLTAKSLLVGKKKAEAALQSQKLSDNLSSAYREWMGHLVNSVRLAMPADCPYSVVHVGDMIGLFSCIFVKTSELPRLRDTALITVKTGFGGRHGNKGAILSRFVIDDSSLCFINCHLAAGQSHRRQRDRDLVDILEDKASFSQLGSSSPGAYAPGGSGQQVFDHEITILSGDLNYRIDARRDVVVSAVASGNCESLLPHDQLLKNLATNQAFRLRSFKEPPIHFPPTYKYDPGTDQYDSSPKRRIPAWCDRILYRADRADKVTPLQYRRWEVNVSDHRPVSSAFDVQIKSVIPEKRAAVWAEVENAYFRVESAMLEETRAYYADK